MSTVKLEVGAWYQDHQKDFVQCISPDNFQFYVPEITDPYRYCRGTVEASFTGPYHIEPGDRVKPKPATDKCWREREKQDGCWWVKFAERRMDGLDREHFVEELSGDRAVICNGNNALPLSCLILLEKGAKAPAQDFQVGDEVEFLGFNYGDSALWVDITIGKRYVLDYAHKGEVGFNDDRGQPRSRQSLEVKLIRRAGEKAITPEEQFAVNCISSPETTGQTASHDERLITHITQKPLNPRVLPSVSGSELLWPDVKPGIELDKLPEDKCTIEDRDANAWSTQTVSTAKAVLNFLCSVETNLGKTNNSDRERIRKIIPEIRKKLATLEREVQK